MVLVVVCLLLVVARLARRRRPAEPDPRRPGDGPGDDDA